MEGQGVAKSDHVGIVSRLSLGKLTGQPQNPPLKEQELNRLLEPLRLSASCALTETLERILHAALLLAHAEHGFMALRSAEGYMDFAVGMNSRRQPLTLDDFQIDSALTNAAVESLMPVRYPQPGIEATAHSLLAPLVMQNECMGYLYLVGSPAVLTPKQEKWQIFQVFVDHAAAAIRNSQYHHLCRQWQGERASVQKSLMAGEQMALQGRMAAKIGHEINNFLSGINANIEIAVDLLHEKSKKQTVIERLEKAQELISRLAALSGSLMSRNGLQANVERSSLNVLVNKFVEFVEPIYRRSDVQIIKELEPRLPDCRIDQGLMIQALFNITKNAVEARPDARIVLRTHYDRQVRRLFLTIEDNGPGMSADTCSRLFNSFYTDKAGGHGYGLAICKDIVEKHGGQIAVESEPKRGARFIISLPVSRKDEYVELEFERIEQLDGAGCFSYPAVIRAQRRRGRRQDDTIEYASING